MQICDVMTRDVECAEPDDTIARAAERMREMNIGSLPVCGDEGKLVGIVTDRDIIIRAIADGSDPLTVHVGDVMTSDIVYCFEDQPISDAIRLMEDEQIRRLAVLDRDRRLVGIVSVGDLAVKTRDDLSTGELLECVSEPAAPRR
jgi:CBS domain-containing protein